MAEPPQLVCYDLLFELGLALVCDMLPLAAPAFARPEVGARRLDAVRAGLQHFHQAAARPPFPLLNDFREHPLAGNRVRHEDSLSGVPADGLSAVRDAVQRQFDHLAHTTSPFRCWLLRQVRKRATFVPAHDKFQPAAPRGRRHVDHLDKIGPVRIAGSSAGSAFMALSKNDVLNALPGSPGKIANG